MGWLLWRNIDKHYKNAMLFFFFFNWLKCFTPIYYLFVFQWDHFTRINLVIRLSFNQSKNWSKGLKDHTESLSNLIFASMLAWPLVTTQTKRGRPLRLLEEIDLQNMLNSGQILHSGLFRRINEECQYAWILELFCFLFSFSFFFFFFF